MKLKAMVFSLFLIDEGFSTSIPKDLLCFNNHILLLIILQIKKGRILHICLSHFKNLFRYFFN